MAQSGVLVVGGGPTGLAAAGALHRVGIHATVLDQKDVIGASWSERYERLHLHTMRTLSGLPHYPIPDRYPKYLPKDQFAEYLQEYARRFALDVRLGVTVRAIHQEGAEWRIETNKGLWQARHVIVATGHFKVARMPDVPGVESYAGTLVHSSEYKTGRDFIGKRVLVIGAGNSGAEIAADLVEQGAGYVAVSIRTPPPIVPRDWLGTPVQRFGVMLSPLPPKIADKIGQVVAKLAVGDLSRYGIRPAAWQPFTANRAPIIDVGLLRYLKTGQIHLRAAVTGFNESGVIYRDGNAEEFEGIIAATGFETGLARIIDLPGILDEDGFPRFRSGEATAYAGLYFMGFTESVRGHLFEANRDARRLARLIKRQMKQASPS